MPSGTRDRFTREQRILKKHEFDRVFQAGRKAFARGLVIYVHDAPGAVARLGLVTSRRFGNAVHRNRARRLLRNAFRLAGSRLPPLDVVAVPQAGSFPDALADVQAVLLEGIERARRQRPRPPRTPPSPSSSPPARS